MDQVRFAPPIVKKDGKRLSPLIVTKDKKARPVPPPPVKPSANKKYGKDDIIYGDPTPTEPVQKKISGKADVIYGVVIKERVKN